ncbi:hypothetical protein HaLaN_08826 [Haematococcus lacustris]|uniref:Uncharacterized protein n=1 Tax=Haematococcus lacustris TaxID=44745 RepID=A0A699YS35_HAELA|nr:hypothetical protein HaLaN_08826 [Haematococcus lacustris]
MVVSNDVLHAEWSGFLFKHLVSCQWSVEAA